jgi:transposase
MPSTVAACADELSVHGGDPDARADVCIDMSPAFIKGVGQTLPQAAITFDTFHAVQIVNAAVDQVRHDVQRSRPDLKKTRQLWLKNDSRHSSGQREVRDSLASRHLKTARAWMIQTAFQDFYQMASRDAAKAFLKRWYFWATHSRLPPVIEAARTIKRH